MNELTSNESTHDNETGQTEAAPKLRGSCFLVTSPIGEPDDLSQRAIRGIQSADLVIAPDEQTAAVLMKRFSISTPVMGIDETIVDDVTERAIENIGNGKRVVILTDPETGISEPIRLLANGIREAGKEPRVLPGVDLAATALGMSGFPTEQYFVAGTMPTVVGLREEFVETLADRTETTILFVSGPRLNSALFALARRLADRQAAAILKPTVPGEAIIRGTLSHVKERLNKKRLRGIVTIIFGPVGAESTAVHDAGEEDVPVVEPSELETMVEPPSFSDADGVQEDGSETDSDSPDQPAPASDEEPKSIPAADGETSAVEERMPDEQENRMRPDADIR